MMNAEKSRYTEAQRTSVEHLDGPLLMCAGAGSGKTFTLQNRIAHALQIGKVAEIDEILAITFTKKAAAEIKHRVRTELSKRGMHEAALLIDDARVSTIHSACKRILREHALELGIDPELELIEDVDKSELLRRATGNVIARARRAGDPRFDALIMEYETDALIDMIRKVIDTTSMMPDGFDSIRIAEAVAPKGSELIRDITVLFEAAYEALSEAGVKPGKRNEENRLALEGSLETLHDYFESDHPERELDEPAALLEFLATLSLPTRYAGAAKAQRDEALDLLDEAVLHAYFAHSLPLTHDLMALSLEAKGEYEHLKEREGLVDQDGLLSLTLQALESHPEIREHYQRAFKLVMVDEFQDTNQLQINLVRHLCGENLATLCTVGDSQQSIYGFRNADVSVYLAHKDEMRSEEIGALTTELKDNFRSHEDILSFVRRICGQNGYFVEDFLDLAPARDEGRVSQPYRGSGPRIEVQGFDYPRGFGADNARAIEARGIANWFSSMRDAGHSLGDMVLLLGKMTGVETYEEAFRSQGLPCVITGGSMFWDRPEVKLVERILNVLANPADTESLFAVLSGEAFALSADDLLMLTTRLIEGEGEKRPVWQSMDKDFLKELPDGASNRLRIAETALKGAWSSLGSLPVSRIAWGLIEDSGWLNRLADTGAEGRVVAANVTKALRIVEGMEERPGYDFARIAARFSRLMIEKPREKMGALIGEGEEVIRIMTVHSSKGLEFPIVAVGNCYSSKSDSATLEMKAVHGTVHTVLEPGYHDEWGKLSNRAKSAVQKLFVTTPYDAAVASAQYAWDLEAAIHEYSSEEQFYETRRLFYVASTRASEALLVAYYKEGEGIPGNVIGDILTGLFPEGEIPDYGKTLVDYDGSEPLVFTRIHAKDIPEEYCPLPLPPKETRVFSYPAAKARERIATTPARERNSQLLSYSSMKEGDIGMKAASRGSKKISFKEDEATVFGAAFHQIGRLSALHGPNEAYESVDRIASVYEISDVRRLYETTIRWLDSGLYAEIVDGNGIVPELSFCVPVKGAEEGEVLYLDGDMDLFYPQEDGGVLVVDYKTGGSELEDYDLAHKKHLLQAQCYAYAALTQGYDWVRLAFVRPELPDWDYPEQPQVIEYGFESADRAALKGAILDAGRLAGLI